MTLREIIITSIQVIGACVTLFIFLTGYSSLPAIFVDDKNVGQLSIAILPNFDWQIQTALILVGIPLFNFVDTWLAISLSKLIVYFLTRLQIDCYRFDTRFSPTYYVSGMLIVLPVLIGINMLLMIVLFGNIMQFWPLLLGTLSIAATAIYYIFWFKKWRYPWLSEILNERKAMAQQDA